MCVWDGPVVRAIRDGPAEGSLEGHAGRPGGIPQASALPGQAGPDRALIPGPTPGHDSDGCAETSRVASESSRVRVVTLIGYPPPQAAGVAPDTPDVVASPGPGAP